MRLIQFGSGLLCLLPLVFLVSGFVSPGQETPEADALSSLEAYDGQFGIILGAPGRIESVEQIGGSFFPVPNRAKTSTEYVYISKIMFGQRAGKLLYAWIEGIGRNGEPFTFVHEDFGDLELITNVDEFAGLVVDNIQIEEISYTRDPLGRIYLSKLSGVDLTSGRPVAVQSAGGACGPAMTGQCSCDTVGGGTCDFAEWPECIGMCEPSGNCRPGPPVFFCAAGTCSGAATCSPTFQDPCCVGGGGPPPGKVLRFTGIIIIVIIVIIIILPLGRAS